MRQPKKGGRQGQNHPSGEMCLAKGCKDESAIDKLLAESSCDRQPAKNQRLGAGTRENLSSQFLDSIRCWIGRAPNPAQIEPMGYADQRRSPNANKKNFWQ